jgi:hypothetical protein
MVANAIDIVAYEHPIKAVTIFKSSKAEIVRIFPIELKVNPL